MELKRRYRSNALAFLMVRCCCTSRCNDYRYIIATVVGDKNKMARAEMAQSTTSVSLHFHYFTEFAPVILLISANLLIVSLETHFWRRAREYLQPDLCQ